MEKLVKLSPIDQAPKNGEDVVCWCTNSGWRTLFWDVQSNIWVLSGNYEDPFDIYEPTHFIDLSAFEASLP